MKTEDRRGKRGDRRPTCAAPGGNGFALRACESFAFLRVLCGLNRRRPCAAPGGKTEDRRPQSNSSEGNPLNLSHAKRISSGRGNSKFVILKSMMALAFVLSACSTKSNMVKITGRVSEAIPQGEILLERFEQGRTVPVTTVHSDHEGNFEIELEVPEPGFYRINIYGQQFETLVLNKDDLRVEASGKGRGSIKITGSKDMEYMAEVNAYMQEYAGLVADFNECYMQARAGQTEKVNALIDERMELESSKISRLKKMAMRFEASLVSLMIVDLIRDKEGEFYFLDSLSVKLNREIPNSAVVELFTTNLEQFRPVVAVGEVAPDISLPTPDGEHMSLSGLRGKYVLLDFWAAWCRPCRMENPNIVAMYDKYKARGFEVFSVSLDRSRQKWLSAIAEDGLRWPGHVSDLSYFRSQAAITYKVNGIPFALLLDPEGRVIGKNLRGRMLQAKLAQIFGE